MFTAHYNSLSEAYPWVQAALESSGGQMMNVAIVLRDLSDPASYTHETELFPRAALKAYTYHNLGLYVSDEERAEHFSPLRGGPQGDYREGMQAKIEKVVLALKTKPGSKRAVLTVPFTDKCGLCVDVKDDAEWKCLREVYFSIEDGRLNATSVMRSQALIILPKNVHMIGEIMHTVADQVGVRVGSLTHFMHFLVTDRK
jgi:thymidylate synthase